MNKREFVRNIKEFLKLDNFKAVGTGAGAVFLVRGFEEIVISYLKYPGVFRFRESIGCRKSFNEVEDILEKYFVKHKINYGRNTIHHSSRRFEDLSLIDIQSKSDIDKVGKELNTMIYKDILPFFESYQTLDQVHDNVNRIDVSELSKFIFSPIHPRIMVIKRLTNACDWENYCEESIKMYKEQTEGKYKVVFEPIYRFLPQLFEELKNLDHIG